MPLFGSVDFATQHEMAFLDVWGPLNRHMRLTIF
jgi:hypothetical protein